MTVSAQIASSTGLVGDLGSRVATWFIEKPAEAVVQAGQIESSKSHRGPVDVGLVQIGCEKQTFARIAKQFERQLNPGASNDTEQHRLREFDLEAGDNYRIADVLVVLAGPAIEPDLAALACSSLRRRGQRVILAWLGRPGDNQSIDGDFVLPAANGLARFLMIDRFPWGQHRTVLRKLVDRCCESAREQ